MSDAAPPPPPPGDQTDTSRALVYNGSKPCVDCGEVMGPAAAIFSPDQRCHHCRRRRHRRHVRNRMSHDR